MRNNFFTEISDDVEKPSKMTRSVNNHQDKKKKNNNKIVTDGRCLNAILRSFHVYECLPFSLFTQHNNWLSFDEMLPRQITNFSHMNILFGNTFAIKIWAWNWRSINYIARCTYTTKKKNALHTIDCRDASNACTQSSLPNSRLSQSTTSTTDAQRKKKKKT